MLPYSNNKEFTPVPVPVPGKHSPNLDNTYKEFTPTPVPVPGKHSPNLDNTYKEFTPTPVPISGKYTTNLDITYKEFTPTALLSPFRKNKVVGDYISTMKTTCHLNFDLYQAVKQHEYT